MRWARRRTAGLLGWSASAPKRSVDTIATFILLAYYLTRKIVKLRRG
jgi:hypothetical protein